LLFSEITKYEPTHGSALFLDENKRVLADA
jgi:hypothetical protein